jgi:hypothetical protein
MLGGLASPELSGFTWRLPSGLDELMEIFLAE